MDLSRRWAVTAECPPAAVQEDGWGDVGVKAIATLLVNRSGVKLVAEWDSCGERRIEGSRVDVRGMVCRVPLGRGGKRYEVRCSDT